MAQLLDTLEAADPATAPALTAFDDAMSELDGTRLTIAAMYLGGEIDRERYALLGCVDAINAP